MMPVVDVVIPAYYPQERLIRILEGMEKQTVRPRCVRVINTQKEGWDALLRKEKLTERKLKERCPSLILTHISKQEFDHGKTRNMGFMQCEGADFVLTMTQDALPRDTCLIELLLEPLLDKELVAVSFARQLPNLDAPTEERLSRGFNYPAESRIKSKQDLEELGVKTYFCSNVCALYRMETWRALGGFPQRAIFNEDMVFAGKVMEAGFQISYTAKACVYHSHNYSASQQFHRNFDLGVSQAQNPQIFANTSSEGEGVKYVMTVINQMCRKKAVLKIPGFVFRSAARLFGYRLGKKYDKLPERVRVACSSNKEFWKQ